MPVVNIRYMRGNSFDALAAKIRAGVARNRMVPDMRDGFVAEAPAMKDAVFRSIDGYLPNRYAAVLRSTLDITTSGQASGDTARVTMTATANGRHIGIVNIGNLRHPVFGRTRVPWVDQVVRNGFVSRPMDSRRRQLRSRVRQALRKFLQEITRG